MRRSSSMTKDVASGAWMSLRNSDLDFDLVAQAFSSTFVVDRRRGHGRRRHFNKLLAPSSLFITSRVKVALTRQLWAHLPEGDKAATSLALSPFLTKHKMPTGRNPISASWFPLLVAPYLRVSIHRDGVWVVLTCQSRASCGVMTWPSPIRCQHYAGQSQHGSCRSQLNRIYGGRS